jgi:hypothetical protein
VVNVHRAGTCQGFMAGGRSFSMRAGFLPGVLLGAGGIIIFMVLDMGRLPARLQSFSTEYFSVSSSALSEPCPAVVRPLLDGSETRPEDPVAGSAASESTPAALVIAAPTPAPTPGPESNCTVVRRDTGYFSKWSPPRCLAQFDIPQ